MALSRETSAHASADCCGYYDDCDDSSRDSEGPGCETAYSFPTAWLADFESWLLVWHDLV
jgi:hypothetical protein